MNQESRIKNKNKNSQGQVLIIVLLVMLVGLTVGLGALGRSTQDVRISSRVKESTQAFAAAEAGIEQALQGIISGSGATGETAPGVTYDVEINQIGAGTALYPENPRVHDPGEVFTVWLVNHDADDNLIETPTYTYNDINVCWNTDAVIPALAVTLIYKQGADYKIANAGYDPDSARLNGFDHTIPTGAGTSCEAYTYRKTIDFANLGGIASGIDPATDTLIALRIKPLYAATKIVVDPNSNVLPSQGLEIISSGTSQVTTRKIKVSKPHKTLPTFFDTTLFSAGGGLAQ